VPECALWRTRLFSAVSVDVCWSVIATCSSLLLGCCTMSSPPATWIATSTYSHRREATRFLPTLATGCKCSWPGSWVLDRNRAADCSIPSHLAATSRCVMPWTPASGVLGGLVPPAHWPGFVVVRRVIARAAFSASRSRLSSARRALQRQNPAWPWSRGCRAR
jgi:hypothetical protein